MKNKNLVTIILNCYNGEKYLIEALKSIENQTYKNWELVFWDNLSTDKSKEILKSFKNKKFRYFKSKKHTSLYSARNLAIRKAKGEYISFLDCDDTWENNKLKKQIKLFEDKKVAVVYGNLFVKKNPKRLKTFVEKRGTVIIFDSNGLHPTPPRHPPHPHLASRPHRRGRAGDAPWHLQHRAVGRCSPA